MEEYKIFDIVEHIKTGNKYSVIATPTKSRLLEYNREPFYEYMCKISQCNFVRCKSEMEDGRFRKVGFEIIES